MPPVDPQVSIIVPAFNAGRTILAAIDSVLAQDFPDFELLVRDDGSTDDTAALVQACTDPRLRFTRGGGNLGPGPGRDALIAQARGRWLAFLDADDAWAPERLRLLLAQAEARPEAMVFDDLMLCQQKEARLSPWKALGRRGDFPVARGGCKEVSLAAYLRSRTLVIKPLLPTAAVRARGIRHPDRRYGEDAEFFIRLMHAGLPCWYLDRPLYLYRLTPDSLSAQASPPEQMSQVLRELDAELPFDDEVRAAIRWRLRRLQRKADYDRYLRESGDRGLVSRAGRLLGDPSLLLEFARRLPGTLASRARAATLGTTSR